ncbi:hypothetical protein IV102_25510 [bacterium]|nr:hypothetical protein [bacterium]
MGPFVAYIQEGAAGCLPLEASLADLETALNCLLRGREYLHGSPVPQLMEQMRSRGERIRELAARA